jgi:hypothetical protein
MNPNKNQFAAVALALGLGSTAIASAAPVTVTLDQSSVLHDGTGYLQVAISDGINGAIDFAVRVLDPLHQVAGPRLGIQSFAFNVAPGSDADRANVTNLPDHWRVRDGYRMENFGRFDIKLYGGGRSQLDTLNFSITGIVGDKPEDYAVLSTGAAADGHQFFAARIAALAAGACGSKTCATTKSAFFGGSTAVPAPAAGWLFLTAAAFVGTRLRRRPELQ